MKTSFRRFGESRGYKTPSEFHRDFLRKGGTLISLHLFINWWSKPITPQPAYDALFRAVYGRGVMREDNAD
jgi:hypothetical protein